MFACFYISFSFLKPSSHNLFSFTFLSRNTVTDILYMNSVGHMACSILIITQVYTVVAIKKKSSFNVI